MFRFYKTAIGFSLALIGAMTAIGWFSFRIYVPPNKCAVLIRKMGSTLGADQIVASTPGQKGIEEEVLGPGRHFRDPFRFDWELKDLTVVPAGNPATWEWVHTISSKARERISDGRFTPKGDFPMIGVVTRRIGKHAPPGQMIVKRDSGYAGILEEVLTPGTYKLNPYVYEIEMHPATVIPAGFVGVVTNLFGAAPKEEMGGTLAELNTGESSPSAETATTQHVSFVRPLAKVGERGTLRDVLQPGVYFINPKLQKVTLIEIGFNEFSQHHNNKVDSQISFPSDTGFLIRVGVTVIWGIDPRHASEIINEFGNTDGVIDKVIEPQLRSICRNIGSTYAARDFIQGEKRELFQKALKDELQHVCRGKNIEVLLALVREIEVVSPESTGPGGEVTEDLKRTIQESYIAKEKQITKEKQRDAAAVKAQLEEYKKKIDIARETIKAQTRILVANVRAEGEKLAAEVDAQAGLEVATIGQQVAGLDAQRTEILGQAKADVEKMKNEADAKGYQLMVSAFGGAKAYNLYTFAENFQPQSIKLIFAGTGTFWTDLKGFEEAGAAKILQQETAPARK
jgi:hypothetical protein